MTPARRHFQAVTAGAEATAAAAGADAAPAPLHSRMLALLHAHLVNLKAIKSRKAKIKTKRAYLPEYAAYIAGVLDADAGGDDLVLVTLMVWHCDVGDYETAVAIGAYAIRHRLTLPATYKRDLPTTLLEEIADGVLLALAAGETVPEGTADVLDRALDLTDDADMPDEVRAKAHKAMGLLMRETAPAAAAAALRLALSYDPGCGVKTEIGRLDRAAAGTAATAAESTAPADPVEDPPPDGDPDQSTE